MNKLYTGEPIAGDFEGKSILSVDQFDKNDIELLFLEAEAMRSVVDKEDGSDLLKRKVLANLFYAPSTRTSSSFDAAMCRQGGSVISINDVHYSSVSKGESLPDTINTMEQYSDVIALRHSKVGSAAVAASVGEKPIINAGDGSGEHPTQALLDLFTINESLGKLDSLTVTMVGDLKHGRTVHSLAKLLSKYSVNLQYVSPDSMQMPDAYQNELNDMGISQSRFNSIDSALPTTDVLYMTRVQKERHNTGLLQRLKHIVKNDPVFDKNPPFVLRSEIMEHAKDDMIVMHPLPRVGEINTDVDKDERAVYFEQMKYGMYTRMALIALVLGKTIQKPVNNV